jgi:hypothetical protein
MTDLRQPAYDDLDGKGRALVDRLAAELQGEPADVSEMFR